VAAEAPSDPEQRTQAAEAALQEALAERKRLWDELNRLKAAQCEEKHYRFMYEQVVSSVSWKLTRPLRTMKWLALELPRRARRFLASRPRS
jgi:hypothetical protein